MVIEREFIGTEILEDVLSSIVDYQIDKMINSFYDKERTNATSELEGVEKQ